MSRKQLALFEPSLVAQALIEAVKKLSPHTQWRNPVMFIVWIGSLLTTLITVAMATRADARESPVYWRDKPLAVGYRPVR